jgi:hypothetical protein
VKLFPWSLLALNPFYYACRLIAGAGAAVRGEGETAAFHGLRGKLKLIVGLLWGDLEAILAIPRTLSKRAALRAIRKLPASQVRALIMGNRIALRDLAGKAALR